MAVKQSDAEQARQQDQQQQDQQGQGDQSRQGEPGRAGQQKTQAGQQNQSRDERGLSRRDAQALPPLFALSPFSLLQRFFTSDFADVLGEGRTGRGLTSRAGGTGMDLTAWKPNVDIVQEGNELVVRADLPGLNPDEVSVEISDDAITLSGERQQEREEDQGGVYRIERTYGAFYRVIPLPDGAMTDRAAATFRGGVLEIRMPAPPEQVSRGRRLEVSRAEDTTGGTSGQQASETNRS